MISTYYKTVLKFLESETYKILKHGKKEVSATAGADSITIVCRIMDKKEQNSSTRNPSNCPCSKQECEFEKSLNI